MKEVLDRGKIFRNFPLSEETKSEHFEMKT